MQSASQESSLQPAAQQICSTPGGAEGGLSPLVGSLACPAHSAVQAATVLPGSDLRRDLWFLHPSPPIWLP